MTVYSKKTKKGIRWYFQFVREGVYHRGGGFPTMREAKDAEARERNLLSPHPKMAFGEVCDKYVSWIKNRQQSKAWIYEKTLFIKKYLTPWFTKSVEEINIELIERHLFLRSAQGSKFSANKDLKFIRSLFNFAIQMGYCDFNPTNGIRFMAIEERIKYVPPLEDFLKICQVANPKEKALLILIFCTLGRIGEVLGIRKDDIFEDYLILRSRKHKDGSLKERKIPMGITLKETVNWLIDHSGESEYLISNPREKGNRYLRRPKLMRSLCTKAKINFFGFHSIRHLATSVLMAKGATLKTLQDLLGHAKIGTTSIYIHSIGDNLQMATEDLGKIFEGEK